MCQLLSLDSWRFLACIRARPSCNSLQPRKGLAGWKAAGRIASHGKEKELGHNVLGERQQHPAGLFARYCRGIDTRPCSGSVL